MAGRGFYSKIALGLVVAATGVGAGDLITAGLAGSRTGLVLLWAAFLGALFMPLLALTRLILNNRRALVGPGFRNGLLVNLLLIVTLAFFAYLGFKEIFNLILGRSPILSG